MNNLYSTTRASPAMSGSRLVAASRTKRHSHYSVDGERTVRDASSPQKAKTISTSDKVLGQSNPCNRHKPTKHRHSAALGSGVGHQPSITTLREERRKAVTTKREIMELVRDFEALDDELSPKHYSITKHEYRSEPPERASTTNRLRVHHRARGSGKRSINYHSSLGENITDALKKNLPAGCGVKSESVDKIVNVFESVLLMLGAMNGTTEPSALLCIIGQFVKSFTKGSIVSSVVDYVSTIVATISHQDSTSAETGFPAFIEALRTLKDKWQVTMCGPFSRQVSRLLGILVAVGIYTTADLTFEIKGFKVLEPDVEVIAANAFDLIDCIFDVSIFFLERSHKTWTTGDPRVFLIDDADSANLDEEYQWVVTNWKLVQSGEERGGTTKSAFDKRAARLAVRLRDASRCAKAGILKTVLLSRMETISGILIKTRYMDMSATTRWMPATFGFFGASGIGKSLMMERFLTLICVALKLPHGEGHTYIHKEGKKHWDGFKNHMNVVFFDDFGNKKDMKDDGGSNVIVDVVNRVPFHPPMASLEDKENSDCHPDIVSYTGHDKTLRAYEISVNCVSVQRRCFYAIDVRPRPEFAKWIDGVCMGIDDAKIAAHYTDEHGQPIPRLIDETMLYTITTVKGVDDETKIAPYVVVKYKGKEMKDVTAAETLSFLIDYVALHREREAKLAKQSKEPPLEQFPLCTHPGCHHFAHLCDHRNTKKIETPIIETGGPAPVTSSEPAPESKLRMFGWNRKKKPSSPVDEAPFENEFNAQTMVDNLTDLNNGPFPPLDPIVECGNVEPFEVQDVDPNIHHQAYGTWVFNKAMTRLGTRITTDVSRKIFIGEKAVQFTTFHVMSRLWTHFDWLKFIPRCVVADRWFIETAKLIDADKLYDAWMRRTLTTFVPVFMLFLSALRVWSDDSYSPAETLNTVFGVSLSNVQVHGYGISFFSILALLLMRSTWDHVRSTYVKELLARNDVSTFCNSATRDSFMLKSLAYSSLAASLYVGLKVLKELKRAHKVGFDGWVDSLLGYTKPESGKIGDEIPTLSEPPVDKPVELIEITSDPEPPKQTIVTALIKKIAPKLKTTQVIEVETPISNTKNGMVNPWLVPNFTPIDVSDRARTSTSDQTLSVVSKNQFYFTLSDINDTAPVSFGNLTFVTPSIFQCQKHYFKTMKNCTMTIRMNDKPNSTNHIRKLKIYEHMLFPIEETDIVFVYAFSAGVLCRDIRHLYPESTIPIGNYNFRMLYKMEDGTSKHSNGVAGTRHVSVLKDPAFWALKYKTFDGLCFPGLCGAVLIKTGNASCILGTHSAGADKTTTGLAAAVDRSMIDRAITHFTLKGYHMYREVEPMNGDMMGKSVKQQSGLHPKHFMNFQTETSHWEIVGAVEAAGAQNSMMRHFAIEPDIKAAFRDSSEWRPPKMKPIWFPYQEWMKKAGKPMEIIDPKLMELAYEDYMAAIDPVVSHPEWRDTVKPLTDSETLNGIAGRRFISSWPIGTAAGLPLEGDKHQLMERNPETGLLEHKPEFLAELLKDRIRLLEGRRTGRPVKTFFKDEAHEKDKARVINVVPACTNHEIRRLFLPIIEMIEMNPEIFEIAVGANPNNHEWDKIYSHLKRFQTGKVFAGDYSGYDAKLSSQVIQAAFRVLLGIARKMPLYSEEDIKIMEGLVDELSVPFIVVDGAVFLPTLGFWISGNSLTVIINAIGNCLLVRCYFKSHYPTKVFNENMALATYGDDNVGELGDDVPLLTVRGFARWLARYGMKFTRFDKAEGEPPDHYSWDEVDFLKRKSIYHETLGLEVGALEPKSMHRMLRHCILKRGNGLSKEDICYMNCTGSLREAFLHGPDFYEDFRAKLTGVVVKHRIEGFVDGLSETYADRVETWMKTNGRKAREYLIKNNRAVPSAYNGVDEMSEQTEACSIGLPGGDPEWDPDRGLEYESGLFNHCFLAYAQTPPQPVGGHSSVTAPDFIGTLNNKEIKERQSCRQQEQEPDPVLVRLKKAYTQASYDLRTIVGDVEYVQRVIDGTPNVDGEISLAIKEVLWLLDLIIAQTDFLKTDPLVYQSGELVQETMQFMEDTFPEVESVPQYVDPTRNSGEDEAKPLGEFFKRPVHIFDYNWTVGGSGTVTFNPWDLFFSNKRVINRISNFAFMRAKLHLKFVINGNAFYYGRLWAVYNPLHLKDAIGLTTPSSVAHFVEVSQKPRCVMNPTTSQGAEMVLPFFYHKDSVSVVSGEIDELGSITLVELNPLLNVSGSTEAIPVSVFAWADEVVLYGNTTVNPVTIVPQAGSFDERDKAQGTFSKTATALSKAMHEIGSIPLFAPLAMPSSMMLKGLASAAHAYGFSRPNVISTIGLAHISLSGSLANVATPDTVNKLTLDDKQELTVDPAIAGSGGPDELSIAQFAGRESFLTQFTWNVSQARDTHLMNMRVTPSLFRDAPDGLRLTPMALAALPFRFWRGSLKFRFEVVASGFHRGRLLIKYDPLSVSGVETNLCFTDVVDISCDSDFGYTIGMHQQVPMLPVQWPGLIADTDVVSSTPFGTLDTCNGVLSISVQNELVTSQPGMSTVGINVYVSADDDFQLFVPSGAESQYTIKYQSGLIPSGEAATVEGKEFKKIGTTSKDPNLTKVFVGEHIGSLRTLMKRYVLHESSGFDPNTSTGTRDHTTVRNAFPRYRGPVPGAVDSTVALTPYNYCNTLLLHLVTACFAGNRGSMRYKVAPRGSQGSSVMPTNGAMVEIVPPNMADYADLYFMAPTTISPSTYAHWTVQSSTIAGSNSGLGGNRGAMFFGHGLSPVGEFEVPFYSNLRFEPGRNLNKTTQSPPQTYSGFMMRYSVVAGASARWRMDHYVSIGEDFQVFFFIGVPALIYEPTPPSPL